MKAYISGHSVKADGSTDSYWTRAVPYRHSPMPHHLMGLQWTASGYGRRIPTEHMVQVNGKWRRVYCCIFSNIGTLYIGKLSPGSTTVNLEMSA